MQFPKFEMVYLVVGKRAVLVDGVDARHRRADRFALEHRLLFALGEQRNVVVDVFQDDVDGRFAGQLLHAIILEKYYQKGGQDERDEWKKLE